MNSAGAQPLPLASAVRARGRNPKGRDVPGSGSAATSTRSAGVVLDARRCARAVELAPLNRVIWSCGTAGDGDDRQGGGLGGKPPGLFIFLDALLNF